MASGVRSSWATSAISCRRRRTCSRNTSATRRNDITNAQINAAVATSPIAAMAGRFRDVRKSIETTVVAANAEAMRRVANMQPMRRTKGGGNP